MPPSISEISLPVEPQLSAKSKLRCRTEIILRVNSATSAKLVHLTQFTIFPKLPGELQFLVWQNAIFPRVVTLKPGKPQLPALLHACHDSRRECILAGYQFWIRDMNTGFVISPWQDILLLDKTSFADSMSYHTHSIHTLRCKSIKRSMFKSIERLAFSVDEIVRIWKLECIHCFFVGTLRDWFPQVVEVIILLRLGPLGSTYDDLYEVTNSTSKILDNHIRDITKQFKHAQDCGFCKGVELKFMRNEKWIT
ncbi:hypothetical protein ONS95_000530 [Cadophora gregata]|uniref:uncharacterized protein n=1 Tax=Cadophora gregata TaxID=51156 RepID=UPI0026DD3730|nr:uncharacterized protein ONS95_000530 [Cadophora gregata]KAK0125457.1 hypothetical protein ONS96_009298 [Cadophora gregata f. sp. sojae]KAK0128566.1 hypothetical protein ONS95_000530 [Cadophora gregata]